jgi:D-amino-acid dehydrogenase
MIGGRAFDVAVVGAGAIGAAVAAELAATGASVVVIERGDGWASGCSEANAGLICPSHATPFARRGDVLRAIRWLAAGNGPFALRARPEILPWLARWAAHSGASAAAGATGTLAGLALESLDMHVASAGDRGLQVFRSGLLDVYETGAAFRAALEVARFQRSVGIEHEVLSAAEVSAAEPGLSMPVAGGLLHSQDSHCDPFAYVSATGTAAQRAGAVFIGGTEVYDLSARRSGVSVTTTHGPLMAETVVLAAGVGSRNLTRRCGVDLPVVAGKGYTVDLRRGDRSGLTRPIVLHEARIAATPLDGYLRLAGTMELGAASTRIDRRRVEGVHGAGRRALRAWRDAPVTKVWSGLRPCTPDGLPIVGRLPGCPSVAVATGHAMLGLTLAPVTGRLVRELLEGAPRPELDRLRPGRFTWRR